jgi:ATP-dependent helicase/nuclease subunit B
MSTSSHQPRVLTIPAGVHFLSAFCHALMRGDVIPDFPDPHNPLALAHAKIYVPTRRAARALAIELQRHMPNETILLPDIVTLGHFEQIETDLIFASESPRDFDLLPSVSSMQRHLELMRLIYTWAQSMGAERLKQALDGPMDLLTFLAIDPPQAWYLARELAALMDEMLIEDIDWSLLETLVPEQFDDYWGVTLDFLKIATQSWPDYLRQHKCLDRVARQKELVEREIKRLAHAPASPLIALGSTGTNRSTARLLKAIAHAPQGAIVLPGLDLDMNEHTWSMLNAEQDGMISGATHPQAALHRLMQFLRMKRADVRAIAAPTSDIQMRMQCVNEALRPAESTDAWYKFISASDDTTFEAALNAISFIEARDERDEALCLALKMREVLETTPDKTAALITPDRDLSMRVKTELLRWGIEIDDSGGQSLALTSMGRLARLTLSATQNQNALAYVPLLAHEWVNCGYKRSEVEQFAHIYELALLRNIMPEHMSLRERITHARARAQDRHAHAAHKRITDLEWDEFTHFMLQFEQICQPLTDVPAYAPLAFWVDAHRGVVTSLRDQDQPMGEDDLVLHNVWDELKLGSHDHFALSAQDYLSLFESILATEMVRGPARAHPRLKILGLLEARLLHVDVALLGGLDETIWPPHVSTDAFLNRPMRAALGLSPPERRIGQTAHDFVQLMGSPEIVLSRAQKRSGAPTVPSRFLQRLIAVVGQKAWQSCCLRGHIYQHWAEQIDAPHAHDIAEARTLAVRPRPCPPLELRPTQLSVTRIETWRRDPYSIYAESILKLRPLDPIGVQFGAREIGTLLHGLIAQFAHVYPDVPQDQQEIYLRTLAESYFRDQLANSGFRLFQWPRYWQALQAYQRWETQERAQIKKLWLEKNGFIDIDLNDGTRFRLTAQADRIEQREDGVRIVDFKTGRVPTQQQVKVGFAPQLTLEAAIAERGGFADVPAQTIDQAVYVKLRAADDVEAKSLAKDQSSLADMIVDHYAGLLVLLNQFRDPNMGYLARPYPHYVNDYSDYDHLARVKEWSIGQGEESE